MAGLLAACACAGAVAWFHSRGYLLYYGDAVAHLNIARRLSDSRTPDFEQIGTVWLPLPHWIMALFVGKDAWWQSGLAGAVPSAAALALAAVFLFTAIRRIFDSPAAGFAASAALLANPNVLYASSVPMTEAFFLASLAATLYFTVLARERQSAWAAAAAGVAVCAGTLVRYEGWFLLPFIALYLAVVCGNRRWRCAIAFGVFASAGPLWWLLHNFYFYGDALEFYRGPYSAKAIYQRALDAKMARYPGDHDWAAAWLYFRSAAQLVSGTPMMVLACAGGLACLWKRIWWPPALLALPGIFYVLSLYSAGTPIFVPHLWPNSFYNVRYGLAVYPLLCLGAAALAAALPRARIVAVPVVALAALWPDSICWKESQVNSEARRAWTLEAASYLRAHYQGGGILASFGDLTGVFQQAGIPLRETLHEGNGIEWLGAVMRPELMLREEWVVALSGDRSARAVLAAQRKGPRYNCVKMIVVKGAPVVEIYRRGSQAAPGPRNDPESEEPLDKLTVP